MAPQQKTNINEEIEVEEMEFKQFIPALPLSFKENMIILATLLPYLVLWYLFRYTWIGEGVLLIPAAVTFFYLRYKYTKKRYSQLKPITLSDEKITLPQNSVRNKKTIGINISEIKAVIFYKVGDLLGKRIIFLYAVISDINERKVTISGFATDLYKLKKELEKLNVATEQKFSRPYLFIAIFILISILFFSVLIFFSQLPFLGLNLSVS